MSPAATSGPNSPLVLVLVDERVDDADSRAKQTVLLQAGQHSAAEHLDGQEHQLGRWWGGTGVEGGLW